MLNNKITLKPFFISPSLNPLEVKYYLFYIAMQMKKRLYFLFFLRKCY
jgi:hypothetical protein